MTGGQLEGNLSADDWQAGFTHGSGGLWCDRCRALVRQSPGDTKAHLAWHEQVEGSGGS